MIIVHVAILAATISAGGPTYDLNGEWRGTFVTTAGAGTSTLTERVLIRNIGGKIVGTKITGDVNVPAGKVTIRGTYDANPFAAQQVCAQVGFVNPTWAPMRVTVVDASHFRLSGGCRGTDGSTWERVGHTTIALDSGVLFDLDRDTLKPAAVATLTAVVAQLQTSIRARGSRSRATPTIPVPMRTTRTSRCGVREMSQYGSEATDLRRRG